MPRTRREQVSNNAADRAGDLLRRIALGATDVLFEEEVAAYRIVSAYRDMHEYPLRKATISVGSFIKTATGDASLRPGQRFKRMDRIIDKLLRYHRMRLSQMEDIGGCRAILESVDQIRAVERRMKRYWSDLRVTDYIEAPKESGYRALHLIARRDGRLIEVQLRTERQHSWAAAVESWGPPALPFNLKDEPAGAPTVVRDYFCAIGDALAAFDRDELPDARLRARLVRLRPRLKPWTGDDEEGGT